MELESTLVEAIVGMGSKLQHLVASQVQTLVPSYNCLCTNDIQNQNNVYTTNLQVRNNKQVNDRRCRCGRLAPRQYGLLCSSNLQQKRGNCLENLLFQFNVLEFIIKD